MIDALDDDSLLVVRADGVLRLTLNRPDRLNAIASPLMNELSDSLDAIRHDPGIRVVLLTGAGRFFCAGADISTRSTPGAPPSDRNITAANRLVRTIRSLPQPVVAAVNGPALGVGVSIAMVADIAIARADAWFQLAFTKIGLMPDGGATALIAASVGRSKALQMALLANRVPAAEAVSHGMIAMAVGEEAYSRTVEDTVQKLANGPSRAFARTKDAVNTVTLGPGLDQALEYELVSQLELLATEDFQEGVAAFTEKRPPRFGDRPSKEVELGSSASQETGRRSTERR